MMISLFSGSTAFSLPVLPVEMHLLEDPDLIKATLLLKEEKNEKEARLEPGRIRTRNLF